MLRRAQSIGNIFLTVAAIIIATLWFFVESYLVYMILGVALMTRFVSHPETIVHTVQCPNCGPRVVWSLACWSPTIILTNALARHLWG